MLSRSLRLVILQFAAVAVGLLILLPELMANDIYHLGVSSGPSILVSKDARFSSGIQYGYQFEGAVEKIHTSRNFSAGAQIGYRTYGDSLPVSGVIYRGLRGISLGIQSTLLMPLSPEWIDSFTEIALRANYSTYQLTQLSFFHLSAGVRPGISMVPVALWDWFVIELSVPVMWEPRRGTPIGVSGGLSLAAVYRHTTQDREK